MEVMIRLGKHRHVEHCRERQAALAGRRKPPGGHSLLNGGPIVPLGAGGQRGYPRHAPQGVDFQAHMGRGRAEIPMDGAVAHEDGGHGQQARRGIGPVRPRGSRVEDDGHPEEAVHGLAVHHGGPGFPVFQAAGGVPLEQVIVAVPILPRRLLERRVGGLDIQLKVLAVLRHEPRDHRIADLVGAAHRFRIGRPQPLRHGAEPGRRRRHHEPDGIADRRVLRPQAGGAQERAQR